VRRLTLPRAAVRRLTLPRAAVRRLTLPRAAVRATGRLPENAPPCAGYFLCFFFEGAACRVAVVEL
jgi:hypothetical protein